MIVDPVAQVFAREWPRLVATLVKDLGDLDLAEDAAQDAFVEAARRWGPTTTPDRPGAWLTTTARRKAYDRVRQQKRHDARLARYVSAGADRFGFDDQGRAGSTDGSYNPEPDDDWLGDAQLGLLFGCCHPSLGPEAQVAMTLRHVGGLSTAQIADAFVVPEATMAKRLVRAKHKVAAAGVPFDVPPPDRVDERLDSVLAVVYLIFTAGHTASRSAELVRGDLCDEARWLAGLLAHLLPDRPEILGLSALLAFTDARRATRIGADGELVLLEDQDRGRWDQRLIADGHQQLERALLAQRIGPYQLQAAIAAVHASSPSMEDTPWPLVADLYRRLHELHPSPVVALNRAVAVAMAEGPAAGLELMDGLAETGELDDYLYLHASRADLLRRLDRSDEAADAYGRAIELVDNEAERRFLQRRLDQCSP